jgi:hypothetical protein
MGSTESSLNQAVINTPINGIANIICGGRASCQEIQINQAVEHSVPNGGSNVFKVGCNGELSCFGAVMISPYNGEMNVCCNNVEACKETQVYGGTAAELAINIRDTALILAAEHVTSGATFECPHLGQGGCGVHITPDLSSHASNSGYKAVDDILILTEQPNKLSLTCTGLFADQCIRNSAVACNDQALFQSGDQCLLSDSITCDAVGQSVPLNQICQSVTITQAPSRTPSATPSTSPIGQTSTPSQSPSKTPSESPVISQIATPSQTPTKTPSSSPIVQAVTPSQSPSKAPSKSPVIGQILSPSATPSASPVGQIATPSQSFFFNDPATTEIYTLSLPDALPI